MLVDELLFLRIKIKYHSTFHFASKKFHHKRNLIWHIRVHRFAYAQMRV